MLTRRPLVALATLILVPAALAAQTRRARPADAPPARRPELGASPTELLNRRRELDLTPRQVARLDSLERTMVTRRQSLMNQARALRDSACGTSGRCSDSALRTLRGRMGQLRSRGIDTTMGRQALAILDSTQRGRVQGMRMARARQGMALRRDAIGRRNEFGPRRAPGRGRVDVGPGRGRMDAGPRRGRGPAEDRWMPRGGGRMSPQWQRGDTDDRPRRPLPPPRRRGDDLETPARPDTTG
ncbi:MAG: hypothetical protein IPK85_09420 [Gemmatimonadetes bacterium]|nr:hypothetical protein [Gemmatimonadota bacterium]